MGIDIGSSSIKVVIGEYEKGKLSISGTGEAPTKGVTKGIITNMGEVRRAIKSAYSKAKRVAGIQPEATYVTISSAYIQSLYYTGVINLPQRNIDIKEIHRVIRNAIYDAKKPRDMELLHAFPYQFTVDDMSGIYDPKGMGGNRLEAKVHLVYIQQGGLDNIQRLFNDTDISVDGIVVSPLASGLAVLTPEERELGHAVLDVGADISDLGIFYNQNFVGVGTVKVGSRNITRDISLVNAIPMGEAEGLKLHFHKLLRQRKVIVSSGQGGHQKLETLQIVAPVITRMKEMFLLYRKLIARNPFRSKVSSITLTGGFANFPSIDKIAQLFFKKYPVSIGYPQVEGLLKGDQLAQFAGAVGAVYYGLGDQILYEVDFKGSFRTKHIRGLLRESEEREGIRGEPASRMEPLPSKTKKEREPLLAKRIEEDEKKEGFFRKFINILNNLF